MTVEHKIKIYGEGGYNTAHEALGYDEDATSVGAALTCQSVDTRTARVSSIVSDTVNPMLAALGHETIEEAWGYDK